MRQRLWTTDTFVDFDHSLNTAIKRLRQALGDEVGTPKYIETIPKRGYRFIGEVSQNGAIPQHQGVPDETVVHKTTGIEPEVGTPISAITGLLSNRRIVLFSLLLIIALLALAHWLITPLPIPRIVRSHALTKSGLRKTPEFQSGVVTDGVAVYFQEAGPSAVVTMRAPAAGGEAEELASSPNGSLRDISPDGSQALFAVPTPTGLEAWAQSLPSGPPRLIIKDARFPTWTADGRSILFVRRGDQEIVGSERKWNRCSAIGGIS